jgi:hypothetical protein
LNFDISLGNNIHGKSVISCFKNSFSWIEENHFNVVGKGMYLFVGEAGE